MCDFEDMDLNQVRPVRHKGNDQELVEPITYTDKPGKELEEEEIKAEEDVWFT
jgi:hypothetical protein